MASGNQKSTSPLFLVARSAAPPPTDEDLVTAYLAGHPDAARQIWQKYATSVDRTLRRYLGPGRETDDLAQEVFLRCFTRLHTLQERNALRAFIYSIAVRVLRWEVRKNRVRRWVGLRAGDAMPDPAISASDFEARQAITRFYDVLDRLHTLDREAFVLRHFEGLTLEEAAETMALPRGTFKRRLYRASERITWLMERDPALRDYVQRESRGEIADEQA